MRDLQGFGRWLIGAGALIILIGILVSFSARFPAIGRLPGDFFIKRDHVSFYFPLTTCLLLSLLLTFLLRFFGPK